MTEKQRHILEHAVGFRSREPFYRNYYVAGPDADSWADLQALCSEGLMRDDGPFRDADGGMHVFQVTEAGKARL